MTSRSPDMPSVAPQRVAIVVPCFNEARRLDAAAFEAFAARHAWVTFLFVDDGSTDGTAAMLRAIEERCAGRVAVLVLPRNGGKGEAVRSGMLAAMRSGHDYVGFWDADLATPLECISDFRALLDERPALAFVIGARVRLLGRSIERPRMRHYFGRVFATAASIMLGLPVYDTQCGAKLFRASPELRSILEAPFRSTWIFDVELIARFVRARDGATTPAADAIYELPLLRWADVAGSKLRPRDYVRAARDLWRIHRAYFANGVPRSGGHG